MKQLVDSYIRLPKNVWRYVSHKLFNYLETEPLCIYIHNDNGYQSNKKTTHLSHTIAITLSLFLTLSFSGLSFVTYNDRLRPLRYIDFRMAPFSNFYQVLFMLTLHLSSSV